MREFFREEFFYAPSALPDKWTVVQTGTGMVITVDGIANGSRYLNIATGTTTNQETIIESVATFTQAVKLLFAISMSQRIINQEVFVEFVGVDAKDVVEVDATYPSTNLNNAKNAAAFKFDGTTATNAIYIVRSEGISELASGASAFITTTASGTGPNFIQAGHFELAMGLDETMFSCRPLDSTAQQTSFYRRTQNNPVFNKKYKVRIRVRNLGTEPASSTNVRIHFIKVTENTKDDISRYTGRASDVADSLPVLVTQMPYVTIVGDVGIQYRANATGAASRLHLVAAGTTNPTVVKASAGRLIGWSLANTSAAWKYVKLHNQTTAPTAGTGVVQTIAIAPNSVNAFDIPGGIAFTTGIALTTVTGAADADVTPVTANDIVGDLFFA